MRPRTTAARAVRARAAARAVRAGAAAPGSDGLRNGLPAGLFIPTPKAGRADWSVGPALGMSADEALDAQFTALRTNDRPYRDFGVEVLYRFSDVDPFHRSPYFGPLMDLGQFERFRRCFHARALAPLLSHAGWETVASFDWEGERGDRRAMRRVRVAPSALPPPPPSPSAAPPSAGPPLPPPPPPFPLYDVTLIARAGGRADGVWYTASLTTAAGRGGGGAGGVGGGGVWPPPT